MYSMFRLHVESYSNETHFTWWFEKCIDSNIQQYTVKDNTSFEKIYIISMTAICNILNGELQPASVHCGFHGLQAVQVL